MLCNPKLPRDVALQHRELLPLRKQIQALCSSPTLGPGHLRSIPLPGPRVVPECRAAANAPSHLAPPARHQALPQTLLHISFKEFIRSKYLHLLQMVNRQRGTESSPWVRIARTKRSAPQPSWKRRAACPAPWLGGTGSWGKPFPLPGQLTAGSSSAQELPIPLILTLT